MRTRRPNRVRQKLADGAAVFGLVCRTLSPVLVELIGLSGFDFVWIDMEHTGAEFAAVEELCRAADARELEPLVRVPDQSPANIQRALDAGASIVNVPGVRSRAEAEAVVRAARFHPLGERGFCTSSRGMNYGYGGTTSEVLADANARVMTMIQIESPEGVENATAICGVENLDVIFIGLGDLSQSLRAAGNFHHPEVLRSAHRVVAAGRNAGKTVAILSTDAAEAERWRREGVRMFCCGVDIPLVGAMLRAKRAEFEAIEQGTGRSEASGGNL